MSKILLIGNTGQLGWELHRSLLTLGLVIPVDYPEFDLSNPDNIIKWLRAEKPDVIINAGAYTGVDQAESEVERALSINAIAPGILAEEAQALKSIFIHFSTDYVFDGQKEGTYSEKDKPNPVNVYGNSKLDGERAVQQIGGQYIIFRTSWLYSTRCDCFVTKVLKWARTMETIRIASDQIGSPTWNRTLADATTQSLQIMIRNGEDWRKEKSGIYHVAGNGSANRSIWAQKILDYDPNQEEQVFKNFEEVASADFGLAAVRPQNSALDCSLFQQTFGINIANWKTSLNLALRT